MAKKKRVTLKDVARSLGVSTTLVSIVLNGNEKKYRIGKEVTQRVIDAAREMNYSPNFVARNLRGGKTQLIGVIVTDISNPFYSFMARIIENKAAQFGYTVVFTSSDEDLDKTINLIDLLISKGVDGLIIVPCDGSKEIINDLHENNTPLVLLDRDFPDLPISYSCLNSYRATVLATEHLIEQGYTNISLIAYNTEMNHILDRIKGYNDTMNNKGLGENIKIKQVNLSNPKSEIYDALDVLINKDKSDAIIFLTNMLAVNGLYYLNEKNIKIPEDIAIVAFNSNDAFNLFYSPVTYINQPLELIATEAVNILMEKLKIGEHEVKAMVHSEPELIIGKSSLKSLKINFEKSNK